MKVRLSLVLLLAVMVFTALAGLFANETPWWGKSPVGVLICGALALVFVTLAFVLDGGRDRT